MPAPPSFSHPRQTPGAGAAGVAVAGASDTLDVDLDAHIIINTSAVDDGVSDGTVAFEQNVNDDLALGAPPGAPGAIDATSRTCANTLTSIPAT
ncbi:hypothetical protein DFH11DRAFT_1648104 [Phellopilus nigrolimitatus]|nr:hypothetical protein DFH11DRAFT_1648104 [Phellopilus nigrolimitatus]